MDAREQLRRYLEQRREMGERELVLDGLTVEEALRIVTGSSRAPIEEGKAPATGATRRADVAADLDWRAALRATGAAPAEPKAGTKPEAPAVHPSTPPTLQYSNPPTLQPSIRNRQRCISDR